VAEPVDWSADGTPRSPRFGDIYHSASGALAQARHVFLAGCSLPQAWAGAAQWRILETGFGLGLNFLAAWRAWKDDPKRPRLLHFVSIEAWPVSANDVVRAVRDEPSLQPLASELAARWWGLVPGLHRISFEDGQVLLTLCIGDVRERLQELDFEADAVFLDGFDPHRNGEMWELATLKAVTRSCRRGARLATWTVAGAVRRDLAQLGWSVGKIAGLPPKRECLQASFEPGWDLRRAPRGDVVPSTAIVIGAGLAGAAVAGSLARRGWQVQVLDRASHPASGASALPAGLLAPHTSPDDNLLSRLSRAGVRMTLQAARDRLVAGSDWEPSGALELRGADDCAPADLGAWGADWQLWRDRERGELWHPAAAWIRPAALVRTWLAQPGVTFTGGADVQALSAAGSSWQAIGPDGTVLGEAPLVILAAAYDSAPLADGLLVLHPVRGQVSWAPNAREPASPTPLNGNGHFLPAVPMEAGTAWLSGSTYVRGDLGLDERPQEHAANLERLRTLAPAVAASVEDDFTSGRVRGWMGVRCASTDRRPLAGPLRGGLWCSVAMGSRGLTFALLCAELLAARLHGEPLPLPAKLAGALDPGRQRRPAGVKGPTAAT
jgi:tRNA 5-methylaminomethyl-2-thiouridine biosynthesis bifunctional protein